MGEITADILDGTICQVCGCLMDDLIPEVGNVLLPSPGYPRNCEECGDK